MDTGSERSETDISYVLRIFEENLYYKNREGKKQPSPPPSNEFHFFRVLFYTFLKIKKYHFLAFFRDDV